MELVDFIKHLRDAQEKQQCVVAMINCTSAYSGRAEAFLPRGDRILVLKQDGTLLIHQPEGNSAVHYLKPGCSINFEKEADHYLLHARSADGKEFVDLELFRVHDLLRRKLDDGQKQVLHGTEKDMSDMIKAQPELISPDFKPLSREEHTKVGFIDVFGHDGEGNLVIVECKRYSASLACVTQLRRYVKKMMQLRGTQNVTGVMAAPAVTPNAMELLKEWGYAWARVEAPKRMERYDKSQKRLGEY